MKTVNDLFILESMKDCKVLAGHSGLNRNVQSVNISDTPDVIDFLDSNHLLLTTAFAFKDDTQKLLDLIQQMHDLKCSGIVIKVYRFLKELPDEVRLLADELSFPIIDFPIENTLGDVSRHILNYLNDHEAEQLYYAIHIQREFSDMMIKGHSLHALVKRLGQFLSRSAILLNHRGEIISYSYDSREDSMQMVEEEIIQHVKENLISARKGVTFTIPSVGLQSITTFPVQTKGQYPSMLVIIDSATMQYPSSQMAIEQAGNVISFTMIKEQAIEENSRLFKNNFFADLIEKRIVSDEEILSRANYYGLGKNMENICIVCHVDTADQKYDTLQLHEKKIGVLHNSIYDQLEDEIINDKMQATLFTKEKYFVMILQFSNYTEEAKSKVTSFIEKIQTNFPKGFTVSFGVSNRIHSITDIPVAYQEAVEALADGYELNMQGFINFYKTREIKALLNAIPRKDMISLYENTLKALAYPKTKEELDLVKTIVVYLDCQCEISETSRKLSVHRNTVKYRIQKTEEMLNCSFRDPADSLNLRIALMIGTILKKEEI